MCTRQYLAYASISQKILDVIPADMPTMDYATRGKVHNYQVVLLGLLVLVAISNTIHI